MCPEVTKLSRAGGGKEMKAQMGPRRCQGPAATAAPEPSRVEGKQRRNRFHKVLINWDFFIMLQLRSRVNGECSEKEKISGIKGQNGQTRRRPEKDNSNSNKHRLLQKRIPERTASPTDTLTNWATGTGKSSMTLRELLPVKECVS